jgi:hypothetical protein
MRRSDAFRRVVYAGGTVGATAQEYGSESAAPHERLRSSGSASSTVAYSQPSNSMTFAGRE